MLKLKLQYFGHLMGKADSFEKTHDAGRFRAGGQRDDRGWDCWMVSPTQWTWVWVDSRSWWWTGRPGVLQFMGSKGVGHDWATELNWWLIHVEVWQKTTEFCKAIILQLKNKLKNKSAEVGCHFLLQGIFPTQGLNPGLPNCKQILYCLEWVDSSSSRRSSWSRDLTHVSCIAGRVFTTEPPGKSYLIK